MSRCDPRRRARSLRCRSSAMSYASGSYLLEGSWDVPTLQRLRCAAVPASMSVRLSLMFTK